MQDYEVEELLYRVVDGYTEFRGERIYDPRGRVLREGKKVYSKTMREAVDLITDKDIYILLSERCGWNQEKESKYKKLPKDIEQWKLKYFENYRKPAQRKMAKANLETAKDLFKKAAAQRNAYNNYTPEGIAMGAMWIYMIDFLYKGPYKIPALNHYHKTSILEENIRDIVLSNEWSSYTCTKNPFGKSSLRLTMYQRQLLTWTALYRNCRSDPDCPNTDILNDHDAFDGWLIQKQRKEKAEKKMSKLDNIDPKANIVFLRSESLEESREIFELNEGKAKSQFKNVFNQLEKQGTVKEAQFAFHKNELQKK